MVNKVRIGDDTEGLDALINAAVRRQRIFANWVPFGDSPFEVALGKMMREAVIRQATRNAHGLTISRGNKIIAMSAQEEAQRAAEYNLKHVYPPGWGEEQQKEPELLKTEEEKKKRRPLFWNVHVTDWVTFSDSVNFWSSIVWLQVYDSVYIAAEPHILPGVLLSLVDSVSISDAKHVAFDVMKVAIADAVSVLDIPSHVKTELLKVYAQDYVSVTATPHVKTDILKITSEDRVLAGDIPSGYQVIGSIRYSAEERVYVSDNPAVVEMPEQADIVLMASDIVRVVQDFVPIDHVYIVPHADYPLGGLFENPVDLIHWVAEPTAGDCVNIAYPQPHPPDTGVWIPGGWDNSVGCVRVVWHRSSIGRWITNWQGQSVWQVIPQAWLYQDCPTITGHDYSFTFFVKPSLHIGVAPCNEVIAWKYCDPDDWNLYKWAASTSDGHGGFTVPTDEKWHAISTTFTAESSWTRIAFGVGIGPFGGWSVYDGMKAYFDEVKIVDLDA